MPTDEAIKKAADALKGFTIKDDEGWGWPMDESEREAAARRVLTAVEPKLPYPNCSQPNICAGKGYCPKEISCMN